MRSGSPREQGGFTYVVVLGLVALLGMALAAIGPMWEQQVRREREQELLRVGRLYAQAIADYHRVSPGNVKRYPRKLEELVKDTRFVGMRRHLRRLYTDPVAPQKPWGLVPAPDGGVMGVFSQSEAAPLRTASLDLAPVLLPAARSYADWKFVARVQQGGSSASPLAH